MNHSRLTSGMLAMKTLESGRPLRSVLSAVSICERKVATGVMVLSDDVHASLAPISIVTYCTPWLTAVFAWPGMSEALAPDRASLYWAEKFGLIALIRSRWLFT